MEVELFREVARFLSKLEPIQQELESIYDRRLLAVTQSDSQAMKSLVEEESPLTDRLKKQLRVRSSILSRAKQAGQTSADLKSLLSVLGQSPDIDASVHQQISDWMKRVDQRSQKLRRVSYTIWHVIRRNRNSFPALRQILSGDSVGTSIDEPERRGLNTAGTLIDVPA